MIITVDKEKCVGCRICELACSYYRKNVFNPQYSNIRIYFNDDGELDIKTTESCDCLNDPLCVELCPVNSIIAKI